MTKDRVILKRNVSEAIELLRKEPTYSNAEIIRLAMPDTRAVSIGWAVTAIRSIPFDTLVDALINGYETEKSAEEITYDRIRYAYKRYSEDARGSATLTEEIRFTSYMDGIRFALNELGVKISGVNAPEVNV